MIKIGLVGGVKTFHGMSFSEMFNGYDREKAEEKNWNALYEARVEDDVRITHIWDENPEDAREVAEICKIPEMTANYEDMIGKVDGVIITDDCTMKHQKRSFPFLKAGIPTMIDKPLSPDINEAEELISIAEKFKTPLMSPSALRFAKESRESNLNDIGEILTGYSICREWKGSFVFYGLHALELLYSVIGPGITSVKNIGEKEKDIVSFKWRDGRQFIVSAFNDIAGTFQMTLCGTEGNSFIKVKDFDYAYSEMLRGFVKMIETGEAPYPIENTLEIIKGVVLAERSAEENGREFSLS
jgi:predicted dehydrogenase